MLVKNVKNTILNPVKAILNMLWKIVRPFAYLLIAILLVLALMSVAGLVATFAYAAENVQTDATIGGSSHTIRIFGTIDSEADCLAGFTSTDSLIPAILSGGEYYLWIDSQVGFGSAFDVTVNPTTLYYGDDGGQDDPAVPFDPMGDMTVDSVMLLGANDAHDNYRLEDNAECLIFDVNPFTLEYEAPPVEDECTGNFDFLCPFTPGDLIASVSGGTRDTGEQNWPLLTFLGIPVTFGIGRGLVALISRGI